MRRPGGQAPDVREASYVGSDIGPDEDTGTFYQGTPAPSSRREVLAPATERRDVQDTERFPRRSRPSRPSLAEVAAKPAVLGSLGAALVAVLLVGVLGLLLSQGGRPEPTPVAAEATPDEVGTAGQDGQEEADEGTWEGLKVKKGLR